jgi:hypothetical protein
MKPLFLRLLISLASIMLAAPSALAADMGGIALHGSVSGTAAYSDVYNYYGETTDSFDVIQKEMTLNGSYRFDNGVRTSVQLYAYELAGYSKLTLDFANLDYSFRPSFGVRIGRNKIPFGLYNEVQDLDQVRIFASLPLGLYPRGLRALRASNDGATLYGNIGTGKAGSIDYQVYAGSLPSIAGDVPYIKGLANLSNLTVVSPKASMGGSLVWNAPVDGLKFSYTFNYLPSILLDGRLGTRAELVARGYGAPVSAIDTAFGAGTWDHSGLFAGTPSQVDTKGVQQIASIEYTRGDWVATAEYMASRIAGSNTIAALGLIATPVVSEERHYYVQLTRQLSRRWGVGAYYAFSDIDPSHTSGQSRSATTLKDPAVAVSFSITPWWLAKAEFHSLTGTGGLNVAGDSNPPRGNHWNYVVLKSTMSF